MIERLGLRLYMYVVRGVMRISTWRLNDDV